MSDDQRRSRTAQAHPHRITVLGSFTLIADGAPVPLGADARRLVAYLAVHPRPQDRAALAADLWPGVPAQAARRLLDDAVAAVDVPGLLGDGDTAGADAPLALAPGYSIDLTDAMQLIRTLPSVPGATDVDTSALTRDILPDWTAPWIAVERERYRQLRLHALEERSQQLTAAGRFEDAVRVARVAARTAPSRESARRAVIEALLAHGDVPAAVAEYDEYQELLRSSVGAPAGFGLDGLLPPAPAWPGVGARRVMPRSAVALPRVRTPRGGRRLVAGGSSR